MTDPNNPPVTVLQTPAYAAWYDSLRDLRARARIATRIRRLSLGNPGDIKSLGGGISELRIDYGPGYRIYIAQYGETLVLLLTGGDKSRQSADIKRARELAAAWESN